MRNSFTSWINWSSCATVDGQPPLEMDAFATLLLRVEQGKTDLRLSNKVRESFALRVEPHYERSRLRYMETLRMSRGRMIEVRS